MIKFLLSSLLIATVLTIPCNEYISSILGEVSDCSITRKDAFTLEWGVKINFKA
jgi:hypothetical protein